MAIALRHTIIELAGARQAGEGQQTKMELIYQYLTGPRFRHRIEAIVEKFADMHADLDKERKTMTKLWARREEQIRCVVESTAGMYGDLQGNRKRVQRLMRLMGIEAIYPKRRTTRPGVGHKIYPYLLRNLEILRPDHVWASDITYVPLRHGFLYLVAIMDWFSRYVLAWRLSNTLEGGFCLEALEEVQMKLVYISCPITLGNRNHNWFQAAEAQVALMRAGYAVHNPAHAIMLPESSNISWDDWLRMDEAIIDRCDLVVRLPGESRGADRECEYAKAKGIPVVTLPWALTKSMLDALLERTAAAFRSTELTAECINQLIRQRQMVVDALKKAAA